MEISPFSDLSPTSIIFELLISIKIIHFCAIFAYKGFKNGVTLTHFGMRKGAIAKIYAVFYAILIISSILTIPVYVISLLAFNVEKIKQALLYAAPILEIGFIFIGIALFSLLLKVGLTRFRKNPIPKNKDAQKIFYSMLLFLLANGFLFLLGLPTWVYVGVLTYFMYFGAFASPTIIEKAMPLPIEKQTRKERAVL